MSKAWMVEDELWELIEPLLPPWPDMSPGPRPVPDRQCLQGILFVLHTGIGWEDLPQELGYGSGMTCWRRWTAVTSTRKKGCRHRPVAGQPRQTGFQAPSDLRRQRHSAAGADQQRE